MQRKLCPVCHQHPVSLNYYRKGKPYYRTRCIGCIHNDRQPKSEVPNWYRSGYRKKDRCDRCSFKFKLTEQSNVYHVDGNTDNVSWTNLKTICLNCQQEISKLPMPWKPSDIRPDF